MLCLSLSTITTPIGQLRPSIFDTNASHLMTVWDILGRTSTKYVSESDLQLALIGFLQALREYLDAEHRAKKNNRPFDFTGWADYHMEDVPQQENGYDCGVFTCHFLEAASRGQEVFAFTQKDMPYLRRRMIWELGNAKLRAEW